VRAQVPVHLLEAEPEVQGARHMTGHLVPVGVHRDSTLTHPRGTLSLWAAVGPVREENTMAFFPRGAADAADSARAGSTASPVPSITPALDPGDVLVFDAERLHASVPNTTDETRVAITTRVVLGRVLRYGPGTHWRPFYDEQLLDTPFASLATLQSRLTLAAYRRWRWRHEWERAQRQRSREPAPASHA
jgi:ectoine hydroxylase-related dioxygenase (phytanoyl-CoA dioxygenase family)